MKAFGGMLCVVLVALPLAFSAQSQWSLLAELQYQNDVVSPRDRWGSPSNYLTTWAKNFRAITNNQALIRLVNDLEYQNIQVSPNKP